MKFNTSFSAIVLMILIFPRLVIAQTSNPHELYQNIRSYLENSNPSTGLSHETCSQLTTISQAIVANADKNNISLSYLQNYGSQMIDNLFASRLALRERMKEMSAIQPIQESCIREIRNFVRLARFLEEYIAEHGLKDKLESPDVFVGSYPTLMKNPQFPTADLRSGDILMSRGNAVVSAAIARIGDDDGQFSHIALVYVDDSTPQKKIYTIEAHIEIGVVVAPIEDYLMDGKVRAVIFRPKDAALAHRAAQIMFNKIQKASKSKKGNILYDFGMDLKSDKEIFCSEVPAIGYALASQELYGKTLELPYAKTKISMKNRKFLNDIGVKVRETFAPADMDIDPRFDLVAEWRDFTRTQRTRFLDAILTSMYDWMETKNYVFDSPIKDWIIYSSAWSARKTILFSPLLKDRFPKNMQLSALRAMNSLAEVGNKMLNYIEATNKTEISKTQLSLSHFQVKEWLEKKRQEDLWLYQSEEARRTEPLFHRRFHPKY